MSTLAPELVSLYRGLRALQRDIHDVVTMPYGCLRHKRLKASASRSDTHLYTAFLRSPGQLDVLIERVVPGLADGLRPLVIDLVACSTGAEAYTIASELLHRLPHLDFHIHASDLHEEVVAAASAARFSREEVRRLNPPSEFITRTFDADGSDFVVKPRIRDRVTFSTVDLLDAESVDGLPEADIVFAQNVMCHMTAEQADTALKNVVGRLKPEAALFIDGMDLDVREALTMELELEPLTYRHRDIHRHARRHISKQWWRSYYGLEPYMPWRANRFHRYSTIFLRHPQARRAGFKPLESEV